MSIVLRGREYVRKYHTGYKFRLGRETLPHYGPFSSQEAPPPIHRSSLMTCWLGWAESYL